MPRPFLVSVDCSLPDKFRLFMYFGKERVGEGEFPKANFSKARFESDVEQWIEVVKRGSENTLKVSPSTQPFSGDNVPFPPNK